jgi:PAS domain S-box-containing protein
MLKPFRYFSVTSLIAFAGVALLLGWLYRQVLFSDLYVIAENNNVTMSQTLANSVWSDFAPLVNAAAGLTPAELAQHPEQARLRQVVAAHLQGLAVVEVTLYDGAGLAIFATEPAQIGQSPRDNAAFQQARAGQVRSELGGADGHLFSSYVPLRPAGPGGPIEAVFEIQAEVTPLVQQLNRAQAQVFLGLGLAFVTLYGLILLMSRRANRALKQQDVARQQTQSALAKSEERFRQVVSSISAHIYMTEFRADGSQINRYISPNVEELTGYPQQTFIDDWSFWPEQLIHPDDRRVAASQVLRFSEGHDSQVEYRMRRADGKIIWVRDSVHVQKNEASQAMNVYGMVSDITLEKQAEEALRESETKFRTLAETATAGIFIHQGDKLLYVNPAAEVISGYDRAALLQMTFAELAHPDSRADISRRMRASLQESSLADQPGPIFQDEVRIIHREGDTRWVHLTAGLIEYGGAVAVLGTIFDITDRKFAEESLSMAHRQAVEASQLKTQLLANVSHELRTPLNAILGYTEMLQEGVYGSLSRPQLEATGEIIGSTGQLLNFVNNLLGQAQIDAGRVIINPTLFAPAGLLADVRAVADGRAQAKGLSLTAEVAADVPPTVSGDPYWIRQIMINLVDNAIKFTEQGRVAIKIFRPEADYWAIQVTDSGPGIPPELQPYIFDPFWQADGTATREHGGSGLGLSLVKQLTTLMAGQITLTSGVGQGSCFTVEIPLAGAEAVDYEATPSLERARYR